MEEIEIARVFFQKKMVKGPENLFEQSESSDKEVFDLLVQGL